MTKVVFGLSYQRETEALPAHIPHTVFQRGPGHWDALNGMTTIFRLAFQAMFSDVRTFVLPKRAARMSGVTIRVRHCGAFRASTADIRGRSAPDHLLVVVLELGSKDRAFDAAAFWRTFRSIESKVSLLERCGLENVVRCYSPGTGKIVGQNSFVVPDELDPEASLLSGVFAFYFLAWLTALRIERTQLRTELSVGRKALAMSGWIIANQRLRIINLSRYFLTEDRTNDLAMKAVCVALVSKFKLQSRYQRALSLHRDFEHHLDNNTKIVQSEQMGSVSNLLLILTLLSVPVSFFGAIVAIDLDGDALASPTEVISDYRLYIIFLFGFIASLLPFVVLKIRDSLRSER